MKRPTTSRATRTLLVLFFCAGIALLGLLAGGEHRSATARRGANQMTGYYPPDMPRYPEAQEYPAGPETALGGTRMRMSFFGTDDEPTKVARYYGNFWRSRRLFVRDDVTHVGGVVSAVDEQRGRVYQALIIIKNGRTLVFPSVISGPLQVTDVSEPPPVPLFPKSRVLTSLVSREDGMSAHIVLSTNDGGLAANLQHYRRELQAAGYRPEQPSSKEPILLYRHPDGGEITINLTAIGNKRVRVHIMAVSS